MKLRHPAAWELALLVVLGQGAASGCRACERSPVKNRRAEPAEPAERAESPDCTVPADCADDNPCTAENCVDGQCVIAPVAKGTNCDNDTVCDGVKECDEAGQCIAGAPPVIDDANACTVDSCDPVRGVIHSPLAVDDSDACTTDACDPSTGQVTHRPADVDDGDDCTTDSCDPKAGVRHQSRSPSHSCSASCDLGFHGSSRHPASECGGLQALRTVCMPNCGPSFYTCDPACPTGYHVVSKTASSQCGTSLSAYAFCQKDPGGGAAGGSAK